METKFQFFLGSRVALTDSEGHIEATSCNQVRIHLNVCVGLDAADERSQLDQWICL